MLHKESVTSELFDTLKIFMNLSAFKDFRLVGGTALSLLKGHRISIDIDLFSDKDFDKNYLDTEIRKTFNQCTVNKMPYGLTCYIKLNDNKELKIDICSADPFLFPAKEIDGIRIASLEDLITMKLECITSRNVKKDYWDIALLLDNFSFSKMFDLYQKRFPFYDIKPVINQLSVFLNSDIENDINPQCLKGLQWHDIYLKIKDHLKIYLDENINEKKKKGLSL